MSRKKRKRFAEIETFDNVFDRSKVLANPDWWKEFYPNRRRLILELGCGKGDLTLELGRRFSCRNILGVDRRGDRIWKGAKIAVDQKLPNVAFLKARIEDLSDYLPENSVGEIWITFPDPLPKRRQMKHRLLAPTFLDLYQMLLIKNGRIHLKTDHPELIDYALATLEESRAIVDCINLDLYSSPLEDNRLLILTDFERRHLREGKKILYIRFGFS